MSRKTYKLTAVNLRCLSVKISIFAIICIFGTIIVGQVKTQDSKEIIFPGPDNSKNNPVDSTNDGDMLIPVDLANKINSIETSNEFLQLLQGVPQNEMTSLFSRFGGGSERSSASVPVPARCIPELQSVPLKFDDDPSTMIFPSCTRIKRCGGCCSSSLLSCQPTATEVRNFEVIVATVKDMGYKGRQIIPLEEHTKCKCDCRIKKEHCSDKQYYEPHNCQCTCSNVDEEQKCRKSNDIKVWNTELCSCACRSVQQCSTGYYFNHNTCRCGPINRPINRFVPTQSSNYNFGNRQPENMPPVIIPLDPTDPRRKHKDDPESRDLTLSCSWCVRN